MSRFIEAKRNYYWRTDEHVKHVVLFECIPGGQVFPIVERPDGSLGRAQDVGKLELDEFMAHKRLTVPIEEWE